MEFLKKDDANLHICHDKPNTNRSATMQFNNQDTAVCMFGTKRELMVKSFMILCALRCDWLCCMRLDCHTELLQNLSLFIPLLGWM